MYISVPKNYSGNAFRPGMTGPMPMPVMPMTGLTYGERKPQPPQAEMQEHDSQDPALQPAPAQTPEPDTQESENVCPKESMQTMRASASEPEEKSACRKDNCSGCAGKGGKNPLTCLFEALRGRGEAGLELEDFLLLGLIVLLMGKEGNEDIVLIMTMLLLI